MNQEPNSSVEEVQQEIEEYFASHASLPPKGALATAHEIRHEREIRARWPLADPFEKLLEPYRLDHPRRIVWSTTHGDFRPLAMADGFAEICRIERVGHCAAHNTDYAWNEEYQLWLPDTRRSLFRRLFMKHYGNWLIDLVNQSDEPIRLGPSTVDQIIDYARRHEGVALSPADVSPVPPAELLDVAALRRLPPQQYLLRLGGIPIIPAETIGLLFGRSESLKSYFTTKLAAAIATGQPTLADLTLDAGPETWVLYVGAENARDLGRRLLEAADQLGGGAPRLVVWPETVTMTDMSAVLDIIRRVKERAGPARFALTVLDTYNQTLGPGDDENSADTARNYTIGMRLLGRALGGTVLTIHHPSAAGEDPRGSTALTNNADFSIRFESEEGSLRTTAVCRKQKVAKRFAPFTLTFVESPEGIVLAAVEAGTAVRAAAKKGAKDPLFDHEQKALVFRTLAKAEPAGLTYGEWKKAASSAGTFVAAKAVMEDREFVSQEPDGRYRLSLSGREQAGLRGWLSQQIV